MKNTLLSLLLDSCLFLVAWIFASMLHYWGGLPFSGAWLISGGFVLVGVWIFILKQFTKFRPYRLIVGINYEALWEDLRLSPAEGPKFENFTFTAISPSLFARSDDPEYSTKLNLFHRIPCGAKVWTQCIGESADRPEFYFCPMRDGYQFGIEVQSEWWNTHKTQLPAAFSEFPSGCAAYVRVVLGHLPFGYIPNHIDRWNRPISLWYPFDWKQHRWKMRLQKQGWSIEDHYPAHLRHRYVVINYQSI